MLPPDAPKSFFCELCPPVSVERELCRVKSVLLCFSVRGKQRTFIRNIAKTRPRYSRRHSMARRRSPESVRPSFQGRWSEAIHERPAQLCAHEVDRARLHGDVESLVNQRVIPALQKLAERRMFLPCMFGSICLKVFVVLDRRIWFPRRRTGERCARRARYLKRPNPARESIASSVPSENTIL